MITIIIILHLSFNSKENIKNNEFKFNEVKYIKQDYSMKLTKCDAG